MELLRKHDGLCTQNDGLITTGGAGPAFNVARLSHVVRSSIDFFCFPPVL